jgi:hypothetical protein
MFEIIPSYAPHEPYDYHQSKSIEYEALFNARNQRTKQTKTEMA